MAVIRVNRKLLFTDNLSLGAGGTYVSSVYKTDRFKSMTGYSLVNSNAQGFIFLQSTNSGFTSSTSIGHQPLAQGVTTSFVLNDMPGNFIKYQYTATSATAFEMNILGSSL